MDGFDKTDTTGDSYTCDSRSLEAVNMRFIAKDIEQEVLLRYIFQEQSQFRIARELGISTSTVLLPGGGVNI